MVREKIQHIVQEALEKCDVQGVVPLPEHPTELSHGDYASNVALSACPEGESPKDFAERLVSSIGDHAWIEKIQVAGPGFINFHLSREFFVEGVRDVIEKGEKVGDVNIFDGRKTLVEYTDPNPFKVFHIGHLMSNAVGESLSRIIESCGAEVKRANYGGDVGLHIAKALWGIQKGGMSMPAEGDSLKEKVEFLGNAYVFGSSSYEENEDVRKEIDELNVRLYEGKDEELMNMYRWGREVSLEKFNEIYKVLGSTFDFFFFESEVAQRAKEVVLSGVERGVFERSDGAVVYKGEEEGLHTRVFLNSRGVPTYEAKDLALAEAKFARYEYDKSYIVTANEVDEYFKVVLSAMSKIFPDLAARTTHISHGMLRFADGKMSSRKGNIITGESLIEDMLARAEEKMADRDLSLEEKKQVAEKVAVSAIKYSILRQAPGRDIIFDIDSSLSFEGDSGPYVQYTYVRCRSLLEKAVGVGKEKGGVPTSEVFDIERLLVRFEEVILRAREEKAPHYIATFLIDIASSFNSLYGSTQIISDDEGSGYILEIVEAVSIVLKKGLWLLGIETVERM